MANLRTLVSKPTRRLLSSLNTATSRRLFTTWPGKAQPPCFFSPGRSLTRPGFLVSSSIAPAPAPTFKSFDRHSYSLEDDTKPHNLPMVCPYMPDSEYDPGTWYCLLSVTGINYKSEEEVLDQYVKLVAEAVGCSENEAKQRIYFVCHGLWKMFAFGAKMVERQADKLRESPYVYNVYRDYYAGIRENFVEEPIPKFSPLNWNARLENMFDYYNSNSDRNNNANATGAEDSGHWLINISKPADCDLEVNDYSIELLAEFLGSEAKSIDKIYAIWCNGPYGFGAEIDQEIAMKLQEHPNVLQVLQDNSFDIKNKELGILTIFPSRLRTELAMGYFEYSPGDEDDSSSSSIDTDTDSDLYFDFDTDTGTQQN